MSESESVYGTLYGTLGVVNQEENMYAITGLKSVVFLSSVSFHTTSPPFSSSSFSPLLAPIPPPPPISFTMLASHLTTPPPHPHHSPSFLTLTTPPPHPHPHYSPLLPPHPHYSPHYSPSPFPPPSFFLSLLLCSDDDEQEELYDAPEEQQFPTPVHSAVPPPSGVPARPPRVDQPSKSRPRPPMWDPLPSPKTFSPPPPVTPRTSSSPSIVRKNKTPSYDSMMEGVIFGAPSVKDKCRTLPVSCGCVH